MITRIFLFVFATLLATTVFGQTIVAKHGNGKAPYLYADKKLSRTELVTLLKSDAQASAKVKAANSQLTIGCVLAGAGGFLIGNELGWLLRNPEKTGRPVYILPLAGGATLATLGLMWGSGATKNLDEAVTIYNRNVSSSGVRQKGSSLNVGVTEHGVGLNFKF